MDLLQEFKTKKIMADSEEQQQKKYMRKGECFTVFLWD